MASDEAGKLLETTRTDGVEHVWKWRAEVLAAAGRQDAARAAIARAGAEVASKANKLRDPELRKLYLASRKI